jgi:hypothetical protein
VARVSPNSHQNVYRLFCLLSRHDGATVYVPGRLKQALDKADLALSTLTQDQWAIYCGNEYDAIVALVKAIPDLSYAGALLQGFKYGWEHVKC